jgi:predicted type IV restriction endonuclease
MSGTDFELYVYRTIRQRFPQADGWEILEQPTLDSGVRPDFVVYSTDYVIVIDAKDKGALEPSDIDQLLEYAAELRAQSGIIYIANDTEVPETVADYAYAKVVEIRRTQW